MSSGAASAGNSPKSAMPQNSTNTQTVSSGSSGMGSMGNSQPMTTSSPQAMNSGMSNNGIGMSDVLRIRMQIRELESSIETLKDQLTPVQIKFNKLLNREIQAPIAIPEKLDATARENGTFRWEAYVWGRSKLYAFSAQT